MKNFTLVSIAIFFTLFVSCSSDDDDAGSQDLIIGKWTLSERVQNGSTTELDDCFKTNTVVFLADGTLKSTFHRIANNSCEFSHEAVGTWKNLGNNKYSITEGDEEPYYSCEINEAGTVFSIEDRFEFQGEQIIQKDMLVKN
ncbi:lipocalin-like domain-containing protein [Aquimarina algiphila]|uniref:Lipocalin family protein n=1 Tax=Aquimarina algiphila TaxID=2047982 RepID=A0A554VCL6_9FLAO|nr:lipocalin family protein [Aquimarina algiphila]TSE04438.1 lipocalin family protein [Aquimarina algiphila]